MYKTYRGRADWGQPSVQLSREVECPLFDAVGDGGAEDDDGHVAQDGGEPNCLGHSALLRGVIGVVLEAIHHAKVLQKNEDTYFFIIQF